MTGKRHRYALGILLYGISFFFAMGFVSWLIRLAWWVA